jgi:Glycosyltransferase family 87
VRAEFFVGALLLGAAVRVAAYRLPGSTDVPIFRVWSHYAAAEGVGRLYGTGGRFPERRVLDYEGVRTKVDYPPLALYELAIASPKALALACDTALASILYVFARRRFAEGSARWAVLAFWLNPAVILLGAVLGYLDVLYLAPAVGALLCALEGRAVLAGALFAAACLTKPLAILIAPAILLVPGKRPPSRSALRWAGPALSAAFAAALLVVLPVVLAGGFLNMLWGVGSLLRDPFVSAAANLWWLASRLATGIPLDVLRVAGGVMTCLAIAWAAARLRNAPHAYAAVALAGFSVHAYSVLAVSVHENHLCGAIPFLALVSAGEKKFVPVLAAASTVAALNMNLFYGLGVGSGWAVPRTMAGIDVMAPLAVGNALALVWHASVLRQNSANEPSVES